MSSRERQEQRTKLEKEIQAFRLFDMGWSIEETRIKLVMSPAQASLHYHEWAALRGQREKIQDEMLKKCLRRHIGMLQEQILWRSTKDALDEAKAQLERCRHLLAKPSETTEQEKEFLLMEYSDLV